MNRRKAVSQDYMGTAEVAAFFKVTRQAVSNWRKRGKMPEPVVVLRMGPIWETEDILNFADERLSLERRRGI